MLRFHFYRQSLFRDVRCATFPAAPAVLSAQHVFSYSFGVFQPLRSCFYSFVVVTLLMLMLAAAAKVQRGKQGPRQ